MFLSKHLLERKIIVCGHYGSGKTEFSVSLAIMLKPEKNVALVDLDIVNPYFRSQECRELLLEHGINLYGTAYDKIITAELPAIGANLRYPLEDESFNVIIDLGGNDSGALVINQFTKYFVSPPEADVSATFTQDTVSQDTQDELQVAYKSKNLRKPSTDTAMLAVVNANRPETNSIGSATEHILSIESATNITITGIVNNTHMLKETTADTIRQGNEFCKELSSKLNKDLVCDCYPAPLFSAEEVRKVSSFSENALPLGLYLRPSWLDR